MRGKKLYIFDLDNTLTESRMPVDEETAGLLCRLLEKSSVAAISGESFSEFQKQLISRLSCEDKFERLFILPTSGGELWNFKGGEWSKVHSEIIPAAARKKIIAAVAALAGIEQARVADFIEDRGGQVTYSALGLSAPMEKKNAYDPDEKKRRDFIRKIAPQFPDFSFRIGGKTSVDATKKGVDKAFGVRQLLAYKKIAPQEAIFVGDALFDGGNDSAVKNTGVEIVATSGPDETRKIISGFLKNEK